MRTFTICIFESWQCDKQIKEGEKTYLLSLFLNTVHLYLLGTKFASFWTRLSVGQRSTKPLSRGVCPFSIFHLRSGGPSSLILLKKDAFSQVNRNICPVLVSLIKQNTSKMYHNYPVSAAVFHSTLDPCCVAP